MLYIVILTQILIKRIYSVYIGKNIFSHQVEIKCWKCLSLASAPILTLKLKALLVWR